LAPAAAPLAPNVGSVLRLRSHKSLVRLSPALAGLSLAARRQVDPRTRGCGDR
jgi:hypothetical protein